MHDILHASLNDSLDFMAHFLSCNIFLLLHMRHNFHSNDNSAFKQKALAEG